MIRCDQITVRGDMCQRRATWERDERDGTTERYCGQHANYYGISRATPSRSRRIDADGYLVARKCAEVLPDA